MSDDSFFKKLESVDRFVKRRRGDAASDAPSPLTAPPPPPRTLSPAQPYETTTVLKELSSSDGFVTIGELARRIPAIEPEVLVSGLLDARERGLVALREGDEIAVSITDAGRAHVAE